MIVNTHYLEKLKTKPPKKLFDTKSSTFSFDISKFSVRQKRITLLADMSAKNVVFLNWKENARKIS